uniref:Uncharacterized protein n=1 Tax=Oryza rufipogon TaxID=4529 RepID=A0A0E0R9R6_ORYRU
MARASSPHGSETTMTSAGGEASGAATSPAMSSSFRLRNNRADDLSDDTFRPMEVCTCQDVSLVEKTNSMRVSKHPSVLDLEPTPLCRY